MVIHGPAAPRNALAHEIACRIERLRELNAELDRAGTLAGVADVVLRHGIEATGASGAVMGVVRSDSSTLERVAVRGTGTHLLFPVKRCRVNTHTPLVTSARTGQSVWLSSTKEFRTHYPRIPVPYQDLALGCTPLVRTGMPLGALGFVFDGSHSFDPAERAFLHTLSRNCLDVLQRGRLLVSEGAARRGADNAAARLERLQRVTAGLNRSLDLTEVSEIVVHQALDGAGAKACMLAVWQDDQPRIMAEVGVTKKARAELHLAFEHRLPDILHSHEPLWPEDGPEDDSDAAPLSRPRARLAWIPIRVDGRLLCALGVKLGNKHRKQSVRVFLCALASLCGQALERARLYEAEREARLRAEQANRLKDEFLGIVSHELRTPLTAISCWVSLLQRRPPQQSELERGLASIARNTDMQARLVEDLLDTSRIVSEKLSLEVEEVALPAMLESARGALAQQAEEKAIAVHVVLPENPLPNLRGDSVRLEQVVRNLLGNAIKFTPSGGRVELRLSCAGEAARIEVVDTGEGIAPDLLPHIFERFRQGDGSSSRRHGGLGLGLSIVRYLVDAHGGRVSAHSEGQGKGTRMLVELPLEQGPRDRDQPHHDGRKSPIARMP